MDDDHYDALSELYSYCPGSNTIEWMRLDKSGLKPIGKVLGYIVEPTCDILKGGIWAGGIYGLFKLTHDPNVQQFLGTLENLL